MYSINTTKSFDEQDISTLSEIQIINITSQCVIDAIKTYGYNISPVNYKHKFRQCVVIYNIGSKYIAMLYFNTPDHSTHTIKMELSI